LYPATSTTKNINQSLAQATQLSLASTLHYFIALPVFSPKFSQNLPVQAIRLITASRPSRVLHSITPKNTRNQRI
jgi:hypothetical protein